MDSPKVDEAVASVPGHIAGFWIRVVADFLDAVFLFLIGMLIAWPLRPALIRLGERGVFIGLAVSMAYTGLLQSRLGGGGRTWGKRVLGLKVVSPDGALISLDRSLVRYALMGLLVYQGAIAYSVVSLLPFLTLGSVQTVLSGITVALFFGCVLVVPFHPLKRGLHDLLAGTIVIKGSTPDPVFVQARMNPRRDRRIIIGAAMLAAVSVGASVAMSSRIAQSSQLRAGLTLLKQLDAMGISNGAVVNSTTTVAGATTTSVVASGFVAQPPVGDPPWAELHRAVVGAIKHDLPPDLQVDQIGTALRTGFNIGIYKSYETVVQIDDARTGQPLQETTRHDW